MSKYNLNEKAGDDYFPIDLDGNIYRFFYPTSEDILNLEEQDKDNELVIEKLINLEKQIEEANENQKADLIQEKEKLSSNIKKSRQSFLDWCMTYIKPENTEAPDFKTTLLKKNIKYLLAFQEIVRTELND